MQRLYAIVVSLGVVLAVSACGGSGGAPPAGTSAEALGILASAASARGAAPHGAQAVIIALHGAGLPALLHGVLTDSPNGRSVVFSDMPKYASAFSHLPVAFDDPRSWARTRTARASGDAIVAGRATHVLTMLNRVHSTILDRTVAYVDARSGDVVRMTWYYTGGGRVDVHERYGAGHSPASMDATFDIAGMHATAHATFGVPQP